jgi:hypothetical protein
VPNSSPDPRMSSLGHSNPGSGFGGPRYPGTFLLALREALAKLNWQAIAWKGTQVECVDRQGQSQQVGLENMYRRLRREPRARWPDLLADLLGSVPPEAGNPPDDLDEVGDRLLVRLGPPFSRQDADTDVWSLPLVENHLAACLVIDYPSSMSYVTEEMIATSDQEGKYWYERAVANLHAKSEAGCVKQVHEESGLLQVQVGDAYDSSRALLLDHLLPGHEENGFFVIVPGRDQLLLLAVTANTLTLAPWLRAIAAKTYREMPYPISPELFWVRSGVWHLFAIESDGEDLLVKPPPAFAEVMARLRPVDAEQAEDEPSKGDGDSLSF